MPVDHTLPLLLRGYPYLSELRERHGSDVVPFRLLGRRAVCVAGTDAAWLFYDEAVFDRQGVVPPTVQQTLFGDSGVQLLDGPAHDRRKRLFLTALDPVATAGLVERVGEEWERAVDSRPGGQPVVLFDAAAEVLARAVHRWCGVPLAEPEVAATAHDLVTMVDAFGSVGGRYLRGRRARARQERRVAGVVARVRSGATPASPGSPLAVMVDGRDQHGRPLDEHVVTVELLNLIRPTVAVAWLVAFAAHALQHWPRERELLATGGAARATAFAHEVRRFYPFAPLLGARARGDTVYDGVAIPGDSLAVLDVFGHNHHPAIWPDPWRFSSERHLDRPPGRFELLAQGGGEAATGHRCPGEPATVAILADLAVRLVASDHDVAQADLRVTGPRRMPARVRSEGALGVDDAAVGTAPPTLL